MSKADVIEIEGTVVEKLPKMDIRHLHISAESCV